MNCIRQQLTKFRMAALALAIPALLFATTARPALAQTLKVDSNYEISGAGYKAVTTSDGTGDLPHKIVLPKGSTSMTFAIYGGTKTKGRYGPLYHDRRRQNLQRCGRCGKRLFRKSAAR